MTAPVQQWLQQTILPDGVVLLVATMGDSPATVVNGVPCGAGITHRYGVLSHMPLTAAQASSVFTDRGLAVLPISVSGGTALYRMQLTEADLQALETGLHWSELLFGRDIGGWAVCHNTGRRIPVGD